MIYNDVILESIVKDFFDTYIIKDNDLLIISLSGGMDSMCLVDAFYKLQSEVNYKLTAIHVHHGIRGSEADRDLEFVKKYCKSMKIDLKTKKVDAVKYSDDNKISLEEAARKLRYEVLNDYWREETLIDNKRNVYILVAHHMRDQAETVIHNLIRGTGIKGLTGIRKINSHILRPLINIEKKEIEKYVKCYDIPYVNDTTNDDSKYTRNFIRNEIIGKFEKINSKAISHIADLSRQAEEINDYIKEECSKAYEDVLIASINNEIDINLKKFRSKHNIIKAGIIKKAFNSLIDTLKDITKTNINDIISLCDKSKGGHLDLPYNITVDKKQNVLKFKLNNTNLSMSRRKKK